MSGMSVHSLASLAATRLPSGSGAKASNSSSLASCGSSSASASGDTTSVTTNADGSLCVTLTNAKGKIVSSSIMQTASASRTNLLNMLV